MRRTGFTLLELLIVMSIIALLASILLPCLMTVKERALDLSAMQVEPNEDEEVILEIRHLSRRRSYDDIYMIEIDPPRNCRISLKKPHPSGMKLVKRDGQDYIRWRPKPDHIGAHPVTVVFEGEDISEQQMTVYVVNRELLEAQREGK